jgi:hypothetical protein
MPGTDIIAHINCQISNSNFFKPDIFKTIRIHVQVLWIADDLVIVWRSVDVMNETIKKVTKATKQWN